MNPSNGRSFETPYPNYDLNNPRDISKYYSEEELAAMSDDEKIEKLNELWNNFCISDTYEPGSRFKPFTIAAGLETGILTGDENYVCGGVLHVGAHDIHCSNRDGHGPQTLKQSLQNSCNVALMGLAKVLARKNSAVIRNYLVGEYARIDLPEDLPKDFCIRLKYGCASLATNAFWQNFNVTMSQMVAAFSSLINGGDYYKPHVVKQIQDDNGNVTENRDPVLMKKTVSKETSDILKDYMLGVVQEGTGSWRL